MFKSGVERGKREKEGKIKVSGVGEMEGIYIFPNEIDGSISIVHGSSVNERPNHIPFTFATIRGESRENRNILDDRL